MIPVKPHLSGIIQETAVRSALFVAFGLGLASAAGAAVAQDTASLYTVSQVSARCATLPDAGPLDLGELADADGYARDTFAGGQTTLSIPGYWCNAPAELSLQAAPLINTEVAGDVGPGFTTRVDYLASLAWDDVTGSNESAAGAPTAIATTEANIGELTITVSDPQATGRLVAGPYEGSVTLTISLL